MIRPAALITLAVAAACLAAPAALADRYKTTWEHVEFGLEHPCTGALIDVSGDQLVILRYSDDGRIIGTRSLLQATGTSAGGGSLTYQIREDVLNNPLLVTAPSFLGSLTLTITASNGNVYQSAFLARYSRASDGTLETKVLRSEETPCRSAGLPAPSELQQPGRPEFLPEPAFAGG